MTLESKVLQFIRTPRPGDHVQLVSEFMSGTGVVTRVTSRHIEVAGPKGTYIIDRESMTDVWGIKLVLNESEG